MNIQELNKTCHIIGDKALARIDEINQQRGVSNPTYTGECNRAAILFFLYFHHYFYELNMVDCLENSSWYSDRVVLFNDTTRRITLDPMDVYGVRCEFVHGELIHDRDKIPEEYWPAQHTIVEVGYKDRKIFIDLTSKQFQALNEEIPDNYIGQRMPWWFYPDRINPKFTKIYPGP